MDISDVEMTKLCAEAMGYKIVYPDDHVLPIAIESDKGSGVYNPLHDDAQVMALVKRFHLNILIFDKLDGHNAGWWRVDSQPELNITARNADLNRAVVECSARIQKAPRQ